MADTKVIDIPFDPATVNTAEEDEASDAADALPAEQDWAKEHLVTTKSARFQLSACTRENTNALLLSACTPEQLGACRVSVLLRTCDNRLPELGYMAPQSQCRPLWQRVQLTEQRTSEKHAVSPEQAAGSTCWTSQRWRTCWGYPKCDVDRFVTDPEFGTILPNASYLTPKTNLTPPMEQYTGMYPFHALPHYESLNAGAYISGNSGSRRMHACMNSFLPSLMGMQAALLSTESSTGR